MTNTPPPADPPEADNADPAGCMTRLVRLLGRCQGMTAFRPVHGTYGGYGGDVKDRMRCTNKAQSIVDGVELCGIHSCNPETSRFHVRNAWPNAKRTRATATPKTNE